MDASTRQLVEVQSKTEKEAATRQIERQRTAEASRGADSATTEARSQAARRHWRGAVHGLETAGRIADAASAPSATSATGVEEVSGEVARKILAAYDRAVSRGAGSAVLPSPASLSRAAGGTGHVDQALGPIPESGGEGPAWKGTA